MPVPSTMNDLSTTASSNSPAGTEAPNNADDHLRAAYAILRTTNAKGADIASAATTDIGAATGEFVDVTGTTTITALGTIGAGITRTVRFTGTLTLTYNATSLILPGSANITTANGDTAIFRSLGSGNWKCVVYQPVNGSTVSGTFVDSTFRIAGSSDATKLVKFEVDGLTTATTRTLTVQDKDLTINQGCLMGRTYYSVVTQTITVTIASPAVVTYAAADKLPMENSPIVFTTTGALPTGITAGITYYIKGASGTTSNISATPGGSAINTSGSQSGTHTANNPSYAKATNSPSFIEIEVFGGGGGGGGVSAAVSIGAGGGSGGYGRRKINSTSLASTETVTVGAGGAAGANTGAAGGAGGTSSFGTWVSCTGGGGGGGTAGVSSAPAPGSAGVSTSADLNVNGNPGGSCIGAASAANSAAGNGGASPLGGAGKGAVGATGAGGNAQNNTGSGGGGACGASANVGGIGASGLVIVSEFF